MTLPNTFAAFLRTAKAATYAAQGDNASVAPLLPDAKQLEYRNDEFVYRDIYVGMFRFIGQEIVYASNRAIWSMSYAGGLQGGAPHSAAKPLYSFLRKALLDPPADRPLRGPSVLRIEDMRYICQINGTLEWFYGIETVAQGDVVLYELRFNGGSVA
jgi:Domain of unknown function (DUF5680)